MCFLYLIYTILATSHKRYTFTINFILLWERNPSPFRDKPWHLTTPRQPLITDLAEEASSSRVSPVLLHQNSCPRIILLLITNLLVTEGVYFEKTRLKTNFSGNTMAQSFVSIAQCADAFSFPPRPATNE